MSTSSSNFTSKVPPLPLPPIHLLDGGLGTTLADQHSVVFDDTTPLWSSHMLLSPSGLETLAKVQTAFAENGADVLLSATYQASYEGFARSGITEKGDAARLMRGAVFGAREAFAGCGNGKGKYKGQVALGLGAYGATMLPGQEYSGKYDSEHASVGQLRDWHVKRMEAFLPKDRYAEDGDGEKEVEEEKRKRCWADVDLVAFETLPRVDEIMAVREAIASTSLFLSSIGEKEKEKKFWISCVFPGEGNTLPDGSSVSEVVDAMLGGGEALERRRRPWGVGINCVKVGKIESLVEEFEKAIGDLVAREGGGEWPALVLYPDGTNGEVYNTTTKVWEKKSEGDGSQISWDEAIYGIVQRARERRAWSSVLVGGCCKVTPEDIGRLRKSIDDGEKSA